MSKISKNIKMLDILSSGKVYSCKRLSEMLEVSPRTIRQYKDELEKEGIYIENVMGKNGGYKLYSKVEVPSILFNENDINKIDLIINKLSDNDKKELENIKEKINNYCRLVNNKDNMSEDEVKVYTAVMRRFAAVFCEEDCKIEKTEIKLSYYQYKALLDRIFPAEPSQSAP